MKSVNLAVIQGNLVRDAEFRQLPRTCVCNFTVAVTEQFKSGEETREKTAFIDCKAWGRLAEYAADLKKGQRAHVHGALETESWDDKQTGQKRSKLLINASGVCLIPVERKSENDRSRSQPCPAAPRPQTAPQPAARQPAEEEGDDIPF